MNVSDMNLRVLQIMSMALSGWARQIDAADVQTLARECGVDEREAVIQLFAAQCGVEDREKIERYFRLSMRTRFCATPICKPFAFHGRHADGGSSIR